MKLCASRQARPKKRFRAIEDRLRVIERDVAVLKFILRKSGDNDRLLCCQFNTCSQFLFTKLLRWPRLPPGALQGAPRVPRRILALAGQGLWDRTELAMSCLCRAY